MAAAFYGRVIKWNLQWGFQRVSCVLTHDKRDSKQRKWGGRERSKKQYTLARQPALFFFFFFILLLLCNSGGRDAPVSLPTIRCCKWWPKWRSRPQSTTARNRSPWRCWWKGSRWNWCNRRSCSCRGLDPRCPTPTRISSHCLHVPVKIIWE